MGKKKKQRRIPVKTGRVVHHFWLNIRNEPEGALDNEMRELKKQRRFAETVRDGLRLILDLRAGSLDVLFELFPHLQERLINQPVTPVSAPPMPDPTELAREIATQIILQGGSNKMVLQSVLSSDAPTQSVKAITGKELGGFKPITLPTFDDDEFDTLPALAVELTPDTWSKNLLDQLTAITQ